MFDENKDPSWPQRESVKLRPREGLSLLSSTAGGSHERYPHQMEFSPQIPPVRGQSGPRVSGLRGSEGTGHLTCQILGRITAAPTRFPGQVDGRLHGLQGLECHTPGPTGGRGEGRDLNSGGWEGQRQG